MLQFLLRVAFVVLRRVPGSVFGWSAGRERARDVIRHRRRTMWERSGKGGVWTPDPRRRW